MEEEGCIGGIDSFLPHRRYPEDFFASMDFQEISKTRGKREITITDYLFIYIFGLDLLSKHVISL